MSPLNASGVDSQGITYSLNSTTKTATITDIPDHRGMLALYEGTTFYIKCRNADYIINGSTRKTNGLTGAPSNYVYIYDRTTSGTTYSMFIVDSKGRIILQTNQNYCIYFENADNVKLELKSDYEENNMRQYWNYNGTWMTSQLDCSSKWDLGSYMNNSHVLMRTYSDNRGSIQWDIYTINGTKKSNIRYTINRGVKDVNGNIYKVVGSTVSSMYMAGHEFYFPRHKSGEISNPNGSTMIYGK